jgi:hypothetical protein
VDDSHLNPLQRGFLGLAFNGFVVDEGGAARV